MSQPIFGNYPIESPQTLADCTRHLEQIEFERKNDIQVIQNLPQIFVLGRKVGRIPSSSADVILGDKIGDFNYDVNYEYRLVNNSGVPTWTRTMAQTW